LHTDRNRSEKGRLAFVVPPLADNAVFQAALTAPLGPGTLSINSGQP